MLIGNFTKVLYGVRSKGGLKQSRVRAQHLSKPVHQFVFDDSRDALCTE